MATTRSRLAEESGEGVLARGGWGRTGRRAPPPGVRRWAWPRPLPWVVVGGLALTAFVVRLLMVRGIWVDGGISVRRAHMSLPGMLQALRRTDNPPPLYFL